MLERSQLAVMVDEDGHKRYFLPGQLTVQFRAGVDEARAEAVIRELGSDVVVDGCHGVVAAAARAFAPEGLDVVLALAPGEALEQGIDTLKKSGRVAYPTGVHPVPRARAGVTIVAYDAIPGPKEYQRLNAAIEAAKLRVPIAAQFPLAQAAQAQQRLEAGHVPGKIVLQIH